MPVTNPSLRKSMAGETTALAKPVMGTSVPAPPKRASLLYRFSPVSRAERNTSVQEVAVPAVFSSRPAAVQPFRISWPTTQMAPPTTKARTVSFSSGDLGAFCFTYCWYSCGVIFIENPLQAIFP